MPSIIKRVKRLVNDKKKRFLTLERKGFYNKLSDEKFLRKKWKAIFGKELNLNNPKTFNEKLQWLKLYDRKPEYIKMVDKCEVKKHAAGIIGEEYIIPTLGVWENYDEIDFDGLPDRFVLKCTHDSGSVKIIKNKSNIDHVQLKEYFTKKLSINYYYHSREWPYKNVKPRIIAEEYIEDDINPELRVYKVFNFNGEPGIIQMVNGDKTSHEYINYYDTEWNFLELKQNYPNGPIDKKPVCLNEILELSAKLSQKMPFIRTDFYVVKGKVLFSEFTFYSDAGFIAFDPKEWDQKLGDMISLPQ